ncbi:MAG: hypothetical protein M3Q03_14030 [Chloroflexota bacterium]|nr:hypothetical protein [Chloroflexota bacterium]
MVWERGRGDADQGDAEVFRREVLPKLQGVPLGVMAKATGLSEGYCSFIRRGEKVPHRRHWASLARLNNDG